LEYFFFGIALISVRSVLRGFGKGEVPEKAGFSVTPNVGKRFRLGYLLFVVPLVLAFLSWLFFPSVAQWVIVSVFGFVAGEQVAGVLWLGVIGFFYTWYTWLAIGVGGVWVVGAFLARRHRFVAGRGVFYPMVSFVVPAFNEERLVGRCLKSLRGCAELYGGNCEVVVVDDGSVDLTFEAALRAVEECKRLGGCRVRWKVVRHGVNLGKVEALRTGVNVALGSVVAVVDADSDWSGEALARLVDGMVVGGFEAVTGYIHPKTDGDGFLVSLQQLEYSQGLGIDRCAQSLGGCVLVVPGAIGVFDADLLRQILWDGNIRSVTEDSEITLEVQKRGGSVGYVSGACGGTDAPRFVGVLWRQRLRWFTGWLHNVLGIHVDLFRRVSWLGALLWYSFVFEFVGAFVDVAAVVSFPFLWWFAPDAVNFLLNLVVFGVYGLLIVLVNQGLAVRFAYGDNRRLKLLGYTPFYPFLWIINVFARLRSIVAYVRGSNGKWH
jgi:cellulose synthase/poly-beta-1,6-N-acetylglucosamine synthase-like glycosyltransferase